MVNDRVISITASFISGALKEVKDKSVPSIINAAFKRAFDDNYTWMISDETSRFKAAVAAIMLNVDEETKDNIKKEMRAISTLNAAMNGIPVDFSRIELPENPLKLLERWRKLKEKYGHQRISVNEKED